MGWKDAPVAGAPSGSSGPAWMGAPVAQPVDKLKDMGKSFVSGAFDTMSQLAGQANPGVPALSMIRQAAETADFLGKLVHGKLSAPQIVQPGSEEAGLIRSAMGHQHTPQTREGRATMTAGQMAPAALAPGSLLSRIANVALPTVGAEGAAELAKALGAGEKGQDMARMLGSLVGGVAAGVRVKPKAADLPADEAAGLRYVDKVAGGRPLDEIAAAPDIATGAEAIGTPGKTALAALARREGTTGEALNAEVSTRQIGRPDRMLDAFAKASGIAPEAAAGDIKALVDAGRAKAAPLYAQSEATPMRATPRLLELAARKPVKAAMDEAMGLLEGDVSIPPEMLAKIKADPNASSVFWDYTHRALNDAAGAGIDPLSGKSSTPNATRIATGLAREFGDALRQAHKPLGQAMDVAGDYLGAEEAFKAAGKDIFNANLTESQLAAKFGKLSESAQQAYRGGIANRFFDLAQNGRLDPKVLKTPRVQAKLRIALGEDGAQQIIDTAGREGDMLAFERRYAPGAGSITSEIAAAIKAQDEAGRGAQIAGDFAGGMLKGHGPVSAAAGAVGKQLQSVLDAIGPTRGMSVEARDAAGRTLMLPPDEMAKAIAAYRALPKSRALTYQPPALLTTSRP